MTDRRRVKNLVRIWVVLGAILIVLIYGGFKATNLVLGPEITILSPENGASFTSSLVEIKGSAKNISFITLNDGKIFTDESGVFDEKILLSSGYNIVTIKAIDRFGRIITKTLQLIYK